jgi:peptidoglycan/xylan/chitin deacetylase (PgdA/CDA1 family)
MRALKNYVRNALSKSVLRHNVLLPLSQGKRFVFLFHDVSPASEAHHHSNYSVTPDIFFEQIRALAGLFDLVSLDTLCKDEKSLANQAAIVFDDGFLSVGTVAAPYLFKMGIPFAVFANKRAVQHGRLWCTDVVLGSSDTAYLRSLYARYIETAAIPYEVFDKAPLDYLVPANGLEDDHGPLDWPGASACERIYLNASELTDLANKGVLVGSHTASHRLMARLSDESAKSEIEDNCAYLENLLQKEIEHFAFPFGYHGAFHASNTRAARSRHRYLYSTNRVFFEREDLGLEGLVLPRIGMRNETRAEILASVNTAFFANRRSQIVI